MGNTSKTGWLACELKRLQDRNEQLEKDAGNTNALMRRVQSLEAECLQLRKEVYRVRGIRRSGDVRDGDGSVRDRSRGSGIESSETSSG